MEYEIRGTSNRNGRAVVTQVDADSEAEARAQARRGGISVMEIILIQSRVEHRPETHIHDNRQVHFHQHAPPAERRPTDCPGCGSNDTAKCTAIYESGTSRFTGSSVMDIGGAIGIGMSEGQVQSRLAARLAPPRRQREGGFCLLLGIGIAILEIAFFVMGSESPAPKSPIHDSMEIWKDIFATAIFVAIPGVLLAIGIRGLVSSHRYNRDVWTPMFAEWTILWVCRRCGKRFKPSNALKRSSRT